MDINKEKIELIKKAFELKNIKKYKEAIEYLYKALEFEDDANDIEIYSQLGELHLLIHNYDRALEEFLKVLALKKNNILALNRVYEIYIILKQYPKALKTAQTLCEYDRSAQSYYCYIKILIMLDKKQDAMTIFNSLIDELKLNADLLYLISTISDDNKKKVMLEKVIELDDTHIQANMDLATYYYNHSDYNKVIKYCLNVDENVPLASYYLGMIEAKRKNYTQAIEHITRAIKFDSNEHDFYLDLAKCYIDISWLSEALSVLKTSINYSLIKEKNENLDEKYFLSAWILIKEKKYQTAKLNLDVINENSKFYPKAQILAQVINLKETNLSTAKSVLEKYFEKESSNPILLDTLASVYKELKLYKKAIEIYKKALEVYPESIYYTLELIDLYIDEKDYNQALELISQFQNNNINCLSVFNSLARIYYRLDEKEKALENIEKYLNSDKNNAESFYFKGLILNDLKEYKNAALSIYEAIKLNPTCAKYYNQMAKSYYGLGNFNDALLYSKEAIELDNNEINYKKLAYEIALKTQNKNLIEIFEKQLKRSEAILKGNR